jgi:hypothetical protein
LQILQLICEPQYKSWRTIWSHFDAASRAELPSGDRR